ncbi:hypothetical protein SAMN07250955_102158 [Arboricoccus pini]|uniref:DUF2497 domain-containing protein n=1 Tax=Arboricoccus pini TaxID=1963835 RepID=A0A212QPS0_9PROT|nr:DUF2497 domain-containing protein [Arboricoccus pini]SNB61271.1 hypothetical protein SAMN07250955_102158 [Arboricoccus pini]
MTDESNRAPSRGAPVPSMEDIMTSIRRMIVNEPEGQSPAPPAPAPRPSSVPQAKQDEELPRPQFLRERSEPQRPRETAPIRPEPSPLERSDSEIPRPSFIANPPPQALGSQAEWRETQPVTVTPPVSTEPANPTVKPAPSAQNSADNGLLSSAAAMASSSAFARLQEAVAPTRARAPSIDELVVEMMRPMLKDWLDANLPQLVERIVEEEVARLVKRESR